ncbi:hypothetical protein L6R52_40175, partial [Myxococcota bacterium]|nr:hypothetical protein [Myxococcota bacterium]
MSAASAPRSSRLDAVLGRLFQLRPGEGPRALSMAGYLMCVVATYAIGRNVGDTLFLSRADISLLPYMYVAGAVTLVPTSWVYSRWIDRGRRDRVIQRVLFTFGGALALFYALLRAGLAGAWLYPTLYLAVGVIGSITLMQVWTLAQDLYDAREAKRLFPLIGAGGVVANVVCGFGIQVLVPIVGPEALLLVGATLLVVAASLVASAVRGRGADSTARPAPRRAVGRRPEGDAGALEPAAQGRYLRLVGAMFVVMFVVVSLVDYQLKVFAKGAYQGAELSAFFGRFYGTAGLLSGFVQFFLTARLLERHSIAVSLVLLPLGIAVGAGSMLAPSIAALSAAVVAKGAETVLRYTVHDAATQLLYVPVPAAVRSRAKATFDGVLKPVATAGAGLLLAALATVLPSHELARALAWADLALVIVWVVVVLLLQREYVSALMKTLRQRRLDFSTAYRPLDDAATVDLLKRSLGSESDAEVLAAIALVPVVDAELDDELVALLDRRSRDVRLAALECLEQRPSVRTSAVRALLDDDDDDVRAAAARVLAARGPDVDDALLARLEHASPKVRASA